MNDTAWKIVKRIEDGDGQVRLVSAYARERAQVTYLEGQWVKAPSELAQHNLHLAIFDDENTAYSHMRSDDDFELWKVEVEGREEVPPFRFEVEDDLFSRWFEWASHEKHWNGDLSYEHRAEWPSGTAMVREVKLVERVATTKDGWLREVEVGA